MYRDVETLDDLPAMLLKQIAHFFEHYTDLDSGKWVKVEGWGGLEDAMAEISQSVQRYQR
jgi:inorganic pyrophosphatase